MHAFGGIVIGLGIYFVWSGPMDMSNHTAKESTAVFSSNRFSQGFLHLSGVAATETLSETSTAHPTKSFELSSVPTEKHEINALSIAEIQSFIKKAESMELAASIYRQWGEGRSASEKRTLLTYLAEAMANNEPAGIIGFAQLIKDISERVHFYKSLTASLVKNPSEQVFSVINAIPDDGIRLEVIAAFGETWARIDKVAAVRWVEALPQSAESLAAVEGVAKAWPSADALGLGEWALALGANGVAEEAAIAELMHTETMQIDERVRTLAGLSSSAERNRVLLHLATQWGMSAPEVATKWAEAQDDPGVKGVVYLGVVSGWARKDPKAAQEWTKSWNWPSMEALALKRIGLPSPDDAVSLPLR